MICALWYSSVVSTTNQSYQMRLFLLFLLSSFLDYGGAVRVGGKRGGKKKTPKQETKKEEGNDYVGKVRIFP